MNFFAVIVFIFAIGSINALPTATDGSDLADRVKKVIDNILDLLPEKLALTDIGFVIPDNDLIKGTVNIDEISLSGFKSPNIETVTYDDGTARLNYELNFEDVHAVVDFTIVLNGLIEISHHFSGVIDLSNVDGQGYAVISQDPKEVTDFSILVSVEKINADIKGLLNDDDLSKQLSDEISQNGAQVVDDFLIKIAPTINTVIKDIINLILKIASQQ